MSYNIDDLISMGKSDILWLQEPELEGKTYYYRYSDPTWDDCNSWYGNDEDTNLWLEKYIVVKITPKGTWVIPVMYQSYEYDFVKHPWLKKYQKFILNSAVRKYCYPTKEEAMNSYIIRKQRQIEKLERDLPWAKMCLELARNASKNNFSNIVLKNSE